mgnify:CR=1 FL=1
MKQYIENNRERFFEELFSILRIPSISAKAENKPDMQRCAGRLAELLKEAGADKAVVMPTAGNPVVYGEKILNPELYLRWFQMGIYTPVLRTHGQHLPEPYLPEYSQYADILSDCLAMRYKMQFVNPQVTALLL